MVSPSCSAELASTVAGGVMVGQEPLPAHAVSTQCLADLWFGELLCGSFYVV
jgi:hypothetical protein